MNAQSAGSVTISSSNSSDPPVIDLNYYAHPYDKRVAIEGMRSLIEFTNLLTNALVTESRIASSYGSTDKEIWEHCKKAIIPLFHFGGTCKMGMESDEMAVVDKEFRVRSERFEGRGLCDCTVDEK
jgi:choline dehydrogenase-like flavoprotein